MAGGVKDYSAAKEYGELMFVTSGSTNLLKVERHMTDILKVMLELPEKPYILIAGYGLLSALMIVCAFLIWGEVELLVWDVKTKQYGLVGIKQKTILDYIKEIKKND